jgi:hypothetical protein
LHRSPKTVDRHVCSLVEKLDVHSRTEAVAAAYARGIVSSGNHLKPNTISRLSSAASESYSKSIIVNYYNQLI